jgi:hypothetical protein
MPGCPRSGFDDRFECGALEVGSAPHRLAEVRDQVCAALIDVLDLSPCGVDASPLPTRALYEVNPVYANPAMTSTPRHPMALPMNCSLRSVFLAPCSAKLHGVHDPAHAGA